MKRAILFLIFNRLDTAKRVFEQIKKAKPERLYIASDGPREEKEGEKEAVDSVRKFVSDNVDWPCSVKTKFNDENLGCARAVSSALNWFFDNEDDGIILEDDCVPAQSFFKYCENLLDYYKEDKNIWHISGYNYLKLPFLRESYYFSSVPHVWGWACWKDRWKKFEFDVSCYDENNIKSLTKNKNFQNYWLSVLNDVKCKNVDSWAYRWFFTILKNNGITVVPKLNMVENIGSAGAHFNGENPLLFTKTFETDKIIHPKKIEVKKHIMDRMFREWFLIDDEFVLKRKIRLFIIKGEWKKWFQIK